MAKQIEETLGLVLESATREFLDKGYEKASLRSIAQNAGVTTGALYVRFANKSELFSALVSPVEQQIISIHHEGSMQGLALLHQGQSEAVWRISDEFISNLVEYIFANRTEFELLINCAGGSPYENFMDTLIEEEEKQSLAYLEGLKNQGHNHKNVSKEDLHVLISAQYYAFFEIVRHNTTKEDAIKRVRTIIDFFRPGWKDIFGG